MGGKYQHGWGALLYKMGKIAHVSHNTKHNHNTLNNQYEQPMPYSLAVMPLSLHGQGKVAPKSLPRCSPTSVHRSQAIGLVLANVNSVLKCHPSKKRERDRAQALGGHHSMDQHNNQPKVGGIKGLEVGATARCARYNKGVGHFSIIWGVKLSHQKMKI